MTPVQLEPWSKTRLLRKLPGGFRNEVYLVEHGSVHYVAKTTRRTLAQLKWLEPVQIAARKAGFVVPEFIKTYEGVISADGVTVETFVEGKPLSEDDLPSLLPQLETFQALTSDKPQRPGFASSRDLLHSSKGGDVDLTQMPSELVTTCREAWQILEDKPHCALHTDLNSSNVLRVADGRFALLDWDEARVDAGVFDTALLSEPSPDIKRALLAWEVACSWVLEPQHARKLAQSL